MLYYRAGKGRPGPKFSLRSVFLFSLRRRAKGSLVEQVEGVEEGLWDAPSSYSLIALGGGNSKMFYFHPENWGNDPI